MKTGDPKFPQQNKEKKPEEEFNPESARDVVMEQLKKIRTFVNDRHRDAIPASFVPNESEFVDMIDTLESTLSELVSRFETFIDDVDIDDYENYDNFENWCLVGAHLNNIGLGILVPLQAIGSGPDELVSGKHATRIVNSAKRLLHFADWYRKKRDAS